MFKVLISDVEPSSITYEKLYQVEDLSARQVYEKLLEAVQP